MRKYEDHLATLASIDLVRIELRKAYEDNDEIMISTILQRLMSLYACLNVIDLREIVKDMKCLDRRNIKSKLKKTA